MSNLSGRASGPLIHRRHARMLERYPLFRMFLLLGQHLGGIFLAHSPNVIKSREVVLATPQLTSANSHIFTRFTAARPRSNPQTRQKETAESGPTKPLPSFCEPSMSLMRCPTCIVMYS